MIPSFGWKAKRPKIATSNTANVFLQNQNGAPEGDGDHDDEDVEVKNGHIDWLSGMRIKRKTTAALEDSRTKAQRLREEGIALASEERFWEAIHKWDEAMQLVDPDEQILDMKAQAYTELRELFPAVQTAELAVKLNTIWWESRQTLGRALLNLGEVKSAVICFQKAIHLNPTNKELWIDDLDWSCKLLKDKMNKEDQDVPNNDFNFTMRECMRVGIT